MRSSPATRAERCNSIMELQKIEKQNVSETVYRQLMAAIMDGTWKANERIPSETELATGLGVSRVTIRGALQRLEGLKLIERRQGDGTFVREVTGEQYADSLLPVVAFGSHDLRDLMEFREIIDCEVAALAARHATADDIRKLRKAYTDHCRAAEKGDLAKAAKFDAQFHFLLAGSAGNPLISQVYEKFHPVFLRNMHRIVKKMGTEEGLKYHSLILDAVERRDEACARDIMREHVHRTTLAVAEM